MMIPENWVWVYFTSRILYLRRQHHVFISQNRYEVGENKMKRKLEKEMSKKGLSTTYVQSWKHRYGSIHLLEKTYLVVPHQPKKNASFTNCASFSRLFTTCGDMSWWQKRHHTPKWKFDYGNVVTIYFHCE